MKYPWLEDYCQTQKNCEKDFKIEWNATRYLIGGKMFALQGQDNQGKNIITLKIEPGYGSALRQEYPDITPRYYMNKTHWNSVNLAGNVPDDILKDMIRESYQLVLGSLSKKQQKLLSE